MRNLVFAALALLAGCGRGSYHSGTVLVTTGEVAYPPLPVPGDPPDYVIDPGADVAPAPLGTYTITANGQGDWYIGWQGDAGAHRFTGDIYCPIGCDITAFFDNVSPQGVRTIANNHVGFDTVTDASVRQILSVSTSSAQGSVEEPLTLDLYIDGAPAVNPYTVFPSGGQLGSTEIMPFNLVTGRYRFTEPQEELAPLFAAPKDKSKMTFSLPAPAPRHAGAHTESLKAGE